jgi:hypothetical protein
MASVAYRAKVEERYQAESLIHIPSMSTPAMMRSSKISDDAREDRSKDEQMVYQ